jgi:hypothetical protein
MSNARRSARAAWLRAFHDSGFLFPACIFRNASPRSHAFARGVGNQGSCGGRSFFDGLRRRFRRSASSDGTRDIGSPAAGGEVEREPSGSDRTRAIQSTGGLRGALVTHHSNARKIYHLDDRCPGAIWTIGRSGWCGRRRCEQAAQPAPRHLVSIMSAAQSGYARNARPNNNQHIGRGEYSTA